MDFYEELQHLTIPQAHGFTTLFVLFKWDLQDAMKDYPEDQHLLSRKAAKAKKEAAAKQAAAKPKVLKSEDVSRFVLFMKSSIILMVVVAGYI